MLANEIGPILSKLGGSPRKKWGQNFMIDERVLANISKALQIVPGEKVLEIGPGLGFLTRELLKNGAEVTAVEKDPLYARYLSETFKNHKLNVLEKDILEIDIQKNLATSRPLKVIGNIPYNITSPIIEWLIQQKKMLQLAVLTVQWELAQRLQASPGSKAWGALSIFVQYHANVSILSKVGKGSFLPVPSVDSAVVKFEFPSKPCVTTSNEKHYFSLVRKAFQKRRKTLLNSLKTDTNKDLLVRAFSNIGFDSMRRPETLSLADWALLSEAILALDPDEML